MRASKISFILFIVASCDVSLQFLPDKSYRWSFGFENGHDVFGAIYSRFISLFFKRHCLSPNPWPNKYDHLSTRLIIVQHYLTSWGHQPNLWSAKIWMGGLLLISSWRGWPIGSCSGATLVGVPVLVRFNGLHFAIIWRRQCRIVSRYKLLRFFRHHGLQTWWRLIKFRACRWGPCIRLHFGWSNRSSATTSGVWGFAMLTAARSPAVPPRRFTPSLSFELLLFHIHIVRFGLHDSGRIG